MSGDDISFLKTNLPDYASNNNDQYRYGFNLDYSLGKANLFTQFIQAKDGALNRYAWYIQPAYKFSLAQAFHNHHLKYFYAIEPVFRYGILSVDHDPIADSQLTRDREELTFAFITYIYKLIILKTEYSIDRIKNNAGAKDYGEFVAQLEVLF